MNTTIVFLFAILLVAAALIFIAITVSLGAGRRQLDTEKYRSRWLAIEHQLRRDDPATYQLCILNADKLLDHALKELGTKGQTMGERMKVTKWSNANAVWSAHKVRNQIAHEADVTFEYNDVRRALAGFKQGLKDLGAI